MPHRPNMNIISVLQYIAATPDDDRRQGDDDAGLGQRLPRRSLRRLHDADQRQDAGRAARRWSTSSARPGEPITLEPMSKFPLVRDLFVDRQRLFNDLKRVKAWVPIDGTYDLGPGPPISQELQEERYPLSRCISCGCCLEACPQYTPANKFVGAAVISQVRLFNDHPIGAALKDERLEVLMGEGGVADCGKAGNCVEVCPKDIPLLESIAAVQRQATVYSIKRFFTK